MHITDPVADMLTRIRNAMCHTSHANGTMIQ